MSNRAFVFTLSLFIAILLVFTHLYKPEHPIKYKCIIKYPKVIVSGSISHQGQSLSHMSGPERYRLYYQGEKEITGDVCRVLTYVTKSEYERQMYDR